MRIASETMEERELRLEKMQKRCHVNIENEGEKDQNERLLLLREKNICKFQKHKNTFQIHVSARLMPSSVYKVMFARL